MKNINETEKTPAGRPVYVLWYYLAALVFIGYIFILALQATDNRFTIFTLLYFLAATLLFLLICFFLVAGFKRSILKTQAPGFIKEDKQEQKL